MKNNTACREKVSREEALRQFITEQNLPIQNLTLLDRAFTHTSYANECRDVCMHHNERLEFLGDVVLDLVIGEYLFLQYPDMSEGELTRAKAAVVCESSLAAASKKLQYGKYLQLGRGELVSGGRERVSILADTFEAVIGAIYLETDYTVTEEFVIQHLSDSLHRVASGHYDDEDYKTLLQEYVQRDGEQKIEYLLAYSAGPDHNKTFGMEVAINDVVCGSGEGKSKKEAEQAAAREAYMALTQLQKK